MTYLRFWCFAFPIGLLLMQCQPDKDRNGSSNKDAVDSIDFDTDSLRDSIVLTNISDTTIVMSYLNETSDMSFVHLGPKQRTVIYSNMPIVFYRITPRTYQYFIVNPRENLKATISQDIAKLYSGDSIRNAELDFSNKMNNTVYRIRYLEDLRVLYGIKIKHDINVLDSVSTLQYNSNLQFLDVFAKENNMSDSFVNGMKTWFRLSLLEDQMNWITRYGHLTPEYEDYLNNLQTFVTDSILGDYERSSYRFRYLYIKYQYRGQKEHLLDSIYAYIGKNVSDIKMKDRLQFLAAKEAVVDRQLYDAWFVKDFINTASDRVLKEYIQNIIDDNTDLKNRKTQLSIRTYDNKKINNLDSLVKAMKGSLVYIDVWASWCMPCRNEMPYSRKLQRKYINKPVKFLFVSVDKETSSWKMASREEGLDPGSSFCLSGSSLQNFNDRYNIKTIPRYMLIGKDGKMISSDAPRPSEPALEKLIEQNL
ncbi:MAG: TlpA disulfide reductase family protein [Chitinophagaceae bacterium]